MNTNIGNNTKSTRNVNTAAKLDMGEIKIALEFLTEGQSIKEVADLVDVGEGTIYKLINGTGAFSTYKGTFLHNKMLAHRAELKETQSEKCKRLMSDIIIRLLNNEEFQEVAKALSVTGATLSHEYKIWAENLHTKDFENLQKVEQIKKLKSARRSMINKKTLMRKHQLSTKVEETGIEDMIDVSTKTKLKEGIDFSTSEFEPYEGSVLVGDGFRWKKYNLPQQPQLTQQPETFNDIMNHPSVSIIDQSKTGVINLQEEVPSALEMIRGRHQTHYLKWVIGNDISIRYHYIFEDRKDLQSKFIIKNHSTKNFFKISNKDAFDMIDSGNTSKMSEVKGYLNKGNGYVKFIKETEDGTWIRRDEKMQDDQDNITQPMKVWESSNGGFKRLIKDWSFFIVHDITKCMTHIQDHKGKMVTAYQGTYDDVCDFIRNKSNIKNDRLYLPSEETLREEAENYRSEGDDNENKS